METVSLSCDLFASIEEAAMMPMIVTLITMMLCIINMMLLLTSIDFCRALCPEGVTLRGLDSLASASLVVVAVPRYFGQMAMINIWLIIM